MFSSADKAEKRIPVEKIWDAVLDIQMKEGKGFRLIGSAELAAWVKSRRKRVDADISGPGRLGLLFQQLLQKKLGVEVDVLQTYFHPLYGKLAYLREKDIQDIKRVYETFLLLKKRSEDAADLYLEDLAHALARSMREEFEKWRSKNGAACLVFGWNNIPLSISVIHSCLKERGEHELLEFFLELMKRTVKYLPKHLEAEIGKGLRSLQEVRRDVM